MATASTISAPPMTLPRYAGPWTRVQAAHLLRRTTFGLSLERIQEIVDLGLEGAVDYLLREVPLPSPPINQYSQRDEFAPIGETWVDKPASTNGQRNQSLASWLIDIAMLEGNHVQEKMTLFWHNHFVVADQNDPRMIYDYSTTLRRNCLGDFRTFVEEITVCPGMLRYLNGRDNRRASPNENYARELLELFTVGKGALAGPGDYTTFTEDDVRAIAVALTGWRDVGNNSRTIAQVTSAFYANQHDTSDKQLSHRFDNAVISNLGEREYKQVIQYILSSPHVALHITRELYRFFVHYEIDEATEQDVIVPLAAVFRDSNYEIRPLLKALLLSDHFYDDCRVGSMIRNPLDFILHTVVSMPMQLGNTLFRQYQTKYAILGLSGTLQMQLYNHPEVAGWKAYYQAPAYYQIWINSVTLPLRNALTDSLIAGDPINKIGIDLVNFVGTLPDPYDVNVLLADIAELLFPRPLTEIQLAALKETLIPGLPDFEWTVEYADYRANEEDFNKRNVIETKLKQLFTSMLRFPEYHLS